MGSPFKTKPGAVKAVIDGKRFKQVGVHKEVDEILKKEGADWVKAFMSNDGLAVLYSQEKTQHGTLKHLSVSRADRHPSWEEIIGCKEFFIGDVDCMMVMPKREDYINIQEHCFHVWETPAPWRVR